MSDKFLAVRSSVISALKTQFPRLRTVKSHGGAVDLKEINRFTLRTPTALVAWVGTTVSRDKTQRASGKNTFGVYVVCKDRYNSPAPDQAASWAERITTFIDGNDFGLDFVASAKVLTTENLYKTDQDVTGTALAAILFECNFLLEDDDNAQDEFPDDQREIEIFRSRLLTPNLGSGAVQRGLTLIHTVTASIKTKGGLSELSQVALSTASATHELSFPYVDTLFDIGCVVKFGGKILIVKDVENENEANRTIILRCASKGSESQGANA